MIKVNLVFDEFYDDVDIIAVPKGMADRMPQIANEFLHWDAPEDDTDYWQTEGERKCKICETVGFVKWLNNTHCKEKNAYIVEQHTDYCPQYGRIDF